jgi:hypothetical protein
MRRQAEGSKGMNRYTYSAIQGNHKGEKLRERERKV